MKRKISIFLSIILLGFSSGITLDRHYCNGKLADVFLLPHFGKCCDSSMPMGDDSCEDDFQEISIDSPFQLVTAKIVVANLALWAELSEHFLLMGKNDSNLKIRKLALVSPPISNIKIYKQVESFLN